MHCAACPVGTSCSGGATLATMQLKVGYYRQSNRTLDVRRCPDAGVNCAGLSRCVQSSSGCVGGNASSPCAATLKGPFCRLCAKSALEGDGGLAYYVGAARATATAAATVAHCAPCRDTRGATILSALTVIGAVLLFVATLLLGWRYCLPRWLRARLVRLHETFTLHVKLKILIGCFMIATQIDTVYEVRLPDDVKQLLDNIQMITTLGFDYAVTVTPLACIGEGWDSFSTQLAFWIVAPFLVIALILIGSAAWLAFQCRRLTPYTTLLTAAPLSLQLLFLVYPIVTREAFEAFPCIAFDDGMDDGRRYLRADVAIECGTPQHAHAMNVAFGAIGIYSIGVPTVFALLLLCSRRAIVTRKPSALSTAIGFLHREYKTRIFWWELMEMLRRLLLVGAFVVVRQGSIEQLAYGNLVALVYLCVQVSAAPFMRLSDDFFAAGCSLLLAVFFLCALVFKYAELTQLDELQSRMSSEQKDDYYMPYIVFSGIFMATCSGVFGLLGVIFAVQAADEARRAVHEARASRARRLRWVADSSEVRLGLPLLLDEGATPYVALAPAIKERFHLFLSHVW